MSLIKLVALDLDGTLFNSAGVISQANIDAIRRITSAGVCAVISTGRPRDGLPHAQIEDTGIDYAITAGGSAIYRLSTGECLYDNGMDEEVFLPILNYLLTKDIHMDAFIDGTGISPAKCLPAALRLPVPESLRDYIINTRTRVDDLSAYIQNGRRKVQKMTLNFLQNEDGSFRDREEVRKYLMSCPDISCVCGGYNNLEFTRADVSKGAALAVLAEKLAIDIADTLAMGDSENDRAILEAAGIGVAMANATPEILAIADYVTDSNDEDGVARALMHFIPELF